MHRRTKKTKARSRKNKPKRSTPYRGVGNQNFTRSPSLIFPAQLRVTLQSVVENQMVSAGAQGLAVRYQVNSMHFAIPASTGWIIPGATELFAIYSSSRIIKVTCKITAAPLEPATSMNIRSIISNQDPGTTFHNYLGMESNQYGRIIKLGTQGSPPKTSSTSCELQSLVGGNFNLTDDAYITSNTTDPQDIIYFGIAVQCPAALTMTAGAGTMLTITVIREVVFFGRELQVS